MNYFICALKRKKREREKEKQQKEKKKHCANNKNVDKEYQNTLEVET